MRFLTLLLLPLVAGLTAYAGEQTHDSKHIQGTWLPTKATLGGVEMTNDFLNATVLTMDNGNYKVVVAGQPDYGHYTIDPTAKPKTIDVLGTEGPNAGKKIPAIYELHRNTLRICYGLGGGPRPAEFKSAPGSQTFLVTYQRKK
jgi:uncharacterized protein (TIGR03067 family)